MGRAKERKKGINAGREGERGREGVRHTKAKVRQTQRLRHRDRASRSEQEGGSEGVEGARRSSCLLSLCFADTLIALCGRETQRAGRTANRCRYKKLGTHATSKV